MRMATMLAENMFK